MVKSKLRYFTYKITFKDLPKYFYYGRHKDSGKPYFGSPKTWRHLWDQFEPEIQILQWFETEEEVKRIEKKIISFTWKDKYSLNEHSGDGFSEESCRRGGKTNGKNNIERAKGIFNPEYVGSEEYIKHRSRAGKIGGSKQVEKGLGVHNPEYRNSEKGRKALVKGGETGGKITGKRNVEEGKGIFNPEYLASEECKKHKSDGGKIGGIAGGKITSSQKWMCTVTQYVAPPGPLSGYQKARGIDTKNRVRIQ